MLAHSESLNSKEVEFLVKYLLDLNYISVSDCESFKEISLTGAGYNYLNELRNKRVNSSQAFVAMWFDDSMDNIFEKGIEPAIRACGYIPRRIDRHEHNNKIDDEIIAEIRKSRFLIADFTQGDDGPRGGVYYEAGFAHGLNIPVIFMCRADQINKIHFDTRQYNHITWETPEELREKLINRIGAVIGDGPLKHLTNKE